MGDGNLDVARRGMTGDNAPPGVSYGEYYHNWDMFSKPKLQAAEPLPFDLTVSGSVCQGSRGYYEVDKTQSLVLSGVTCLVGSQRNAGVDCKPVAVAVAGIDGKPSFINIEPYHDREGRRKLIEISEGGRKISGRIADGAAHALIRGAETLLPKHTLVTIEADLKSGKRYVTKFNTMHLSELGWKTPEVSVNFGGKDVMVTSWSASRTAEMFDGKRERVPGLSVDAQTNIYSVTLARDTEFSIGINERVVLKGGRIIYVEYDHKGRILAGTIVGRANEKIVRLHVGKRILLFCEETLIEFDVDKQQRIIRGVLIDSEWQKPDRRGVCKITFDYSDPQSIVGKYEAPGRQNLRIDY